MGIVCFALGVPPRGEIVTPVIVVVAGTGTEVGDPKGGMIGELGGVGGVFKTLLEVGVVGGVVAGERGCDGVLIILGLKFFCLDPILNVCI